MPGLELKVVSVYLNAQQLSGSIQVTLGDDIQCTVIIVYLSNY